MTDILMHDKLNSKIIKSLREQSNLALPEDKFASELNQELSIRNDVLTSKIEYEVIKSVGKFSQIEIAKAGSGEPIIFLHGVGSIPSAYEKVIKYLAKNHFVIAPALPGHGKTALDKWFRQTKAEDLMNFYSDFIKSILEYYKIERPVVLIGHNFGGGIGIKFATQYAEKISQLVLIDSSTEPINLLSREAISNVIKMNWEFLKHARYLPYKVVTSFVKNFSNMRYYTSIVSKINLIPDFENLKVNTVIYWGEKDSLYPVEKAKKLKEILHKAELNIIQNRDHNWLLDSPESIKLQN